MTNDINWYPEGQEPLVPRPCDNPQCCCNTDEHEWDDATAIELDAGTILKYKKRYGSYYLATSRAILEHYKQHGTKEEIKRRKQIWSYDKATNRRITARAFLRGFKRGFILVFTGGKTK